MLASVAAGVAASRAWHPLASAPTTMSHADLASADQLRADEARRTLWAHLTQPRRSAPTPPPAPPPPPPPPPYSAGVFAMYTAGPPMPAKPAVAYPGASIRRGGGNRLVQPAAPTVTGLLEPMAVRRVVLRNIGQIVYCHEQGLRWSPRNVGRVVIRFIIGGDGRVLGASVTESDLTFPPPARCIADAFRRWQFPAPEGGGVVTVTYPLDLFSPP